MTLAELFQSIADAIRAKSGKTDTLKPINFSSEIENIQTGDEELIETIKNMVERPRYSEIKIPNGITKIAKFFYYRASFGVSAISIPSTVTIIEESAFDGCQEMTTFQIPSTSQLKEIGKSAFMQCSKLTEFAFPEGLTTIGETAFTGSGLTSIKIPSSVTTIYGFAFQNCSSVISVIFDGGEPYFYGGTFNNCKKLESVDMSRITCSRTGYQMFYNCTSLKSISWPIGVTEIYNQTFYGSGIESLEIPGTITIIYDSAFANSYLSSVTIPSSVTEIKTKAFANTKGTPLVVYMESETPCIVGADTFTTSNLERIYVPEGCKATYVAATNWANYADYIFEPCVINISIASALLNNENYLYSMDKGETWEQFTDTLITFENVTSIKFKNADANTTMLLGTTEGGDEIATIANAETIYNTSGDANIYITLA